MTCEGVYQSLRCCEFSALMTTPCQTLTYPQVQIGTRPMTSRTAPAPAATINPHASPCARVHVAAEVGFTRPILLTLDPSLRLFRAGEQSLWLTRQTNVEERSAAR